MRDYGRLSVTELINKMYKFGHLENGKLNNEGQFYKLVDCEHSKELNHQFFEENLKIILTVDKIAFNKNKGALIAEVILFESSVEAFEMLDMHLSICSFIYLVSKKVTDVPLEICVKNGDDIKFISKNMNHLDCQKAYNKLLDRFSEIINFDKNRIFNRNQSIEVCKFPYNEFRKGQRDLSVAVYQTIKAEGVLYSEAPTGIGKTMGVLFPAVRLLVMEDELKIVYVTSKTSTSIIVQKALEDIVGSGIKINGVIITAKEKVCKNEKMKCICKSEQCIFARQYYKKLEHAIRDILSNESIITRDLIEKYAVKYEICPFEFSLDVSTRVDCIVCDLNYVFDPQVYLKRLMNRKKKKNIYLLDEAHNLIDRISEMFSFELTRKWVTEIRRVLKGTEHNVQEDFKKLHTELTDLIKPLNIGESIHYTRIPINILLIIKEIVKKIKATPISDYFVKTEDIRLSSEVWRLCKIFDSIEDGFGGFIEKNMRGYSLKLICLNISSIVNKIVSASKASIFFSATLSPFDYFIKSTSNNDKPYKIQIGFPFDKDNLIVLLNDKISLKYKDRSNSIEAVVASVCSAIWTKKGRYFLFVPSYEYMESVYERILKENSFKVIKQSLNMTEKDKEEFLEEFKRDNYDYLVGVVLLGGIFGEGIDLKGEFLDGVIIVSTGIPKICSQKEIIKQYYDSVGENGYNFSYLFPGFNKIMQAGGRLLRTETDKGFIFLIDDRYSKYPYTNLIPSWWKPVIKANTTDDVIRELEAFWTRKYN